MDLMPIYLFFTLAVIILYTCLGAVIYFGSDKLSSRTFSINIIFIIIWTISLYIIPSIQNSLYENILLKFTFFMGGVISSAFYYFCITFPEDNSPPKSLLPIIVSIHSVYAILYFFTDLIIGQSYRISALWGWGQTYGPLWFLFDICFFSFWGLGVIKLFKKYKLQQDIAVKKNLGYMIAGLLVGFIPPAIFDVILPRLGYFESNIFGSVSGIIWVIIIFYSIIRYRQMNVRTVVTEVLVLGMTIVFLINIFANISWGILGRILTFIAFIALAIFLIRLSLRESEQREKLKTLNSHLSELVAAQTQEIRKSYEIEKHTRRELEKLNETKDQFIMITQHHLRTPVTRIDWELESITKGSYGSISPEVKTALDEVRDSAGRLTRIVDDFLSITAIKTGSQILNIEDGYVKNILEDVLNELKIDIRKARLTVEYPTDSKDWEELPLDIGKMHEVLLIILENAVKYNIAGGTITIRTSATSKIFEMTIANTGAGFTVEEKENIFKRLFYRGDRAKTMNPIGMGIGLSVARAIVRAHHGELSIDSQGIGRGARVTLTLPRQNLFASEQKTGHEE